MAFPSADDAAPEIVIRGPKAEVAAVHPEVTAVVEEARRQETLHSYKTVVLVDPSFVKFIIGKDGSAVNKLSAAHNVRVDIEQAAKKGGEGSDAKAGKAADGKAADAKAAKATPDPKAGKAPAAKAADKPAAAAAAAAAPAVEKDQVIISGQKDGVEAAKREIEQRIKDLVRLRANVARGTRVALQVRGADVLRRADL